MQGARASPKNKKFPKGGITFSFFPLHSWLRPYVFREERSTNKKGKGKCNKEGQLWLINGCIYGETIVKGFH